MNFYVTGSLTRPRTYAFNDVMSHSDIGQIMAVPVMPRSSSTGRALSEKQREVEGSHIINSWSDVQASEQSLRKSRNSVDSDISVITNPSDASISVISESSVETISETSKEQNAVDNCFATSTPQKLDKDDVYNSSVPKSLNLNGITEEEEMTPVGSPLSNSICSSMVSSVYENTLSIDNDNQENSQVKDLTVMKETSDLENNNGDSNIYSQDTRYETCDQNSSINFNSKALLNRTSGPDSSAGVNESGYSWLQNLDNQHHVDFGVVDHRLQLYLDMNILEESDNVQCCIKVSYKNSIHSLL